MLPGVGPSRRPSLERLHPAPGQGARLAKGAPRNRRSRAKKARLAGSSSPRRWQLADEQAKGPGHLIPMVVAAGYEDYLQESSQLLRAARGPRAGGRVCGTVRDPRGVPQRGGPATNLDTHTGREATPTRSRSGSRPSTRPRGWSSTGFVMMCATGCFLRAARSRVRTARRRGARVFYVPSPARKPSCT
ncbi:MAG: hypothetical protein CM1200mP34_4540 [Verrucomicrobiales bacterium]|nr:MAG: hypothetical protein CM1200mP34_4540 [Verrucomicrobiales bacterium]